MSKHIETVRIPSAQFERVNRLLAIPSLEDMSDDDLIEQGANTYHSEGIYCVKFDDGSSLNFDLCSGSVNYWDDVVWTSADGSVDIMLECDYELGNIEFEIDGETYVVNLVKV